MFSPQQRIWKLCKLKPFSDIYHTAIHLLPLPWLSLCGSGNVQVSIGECEHWSTGASVANPDMHGERGAACLHQTIVCSFIIIIRATKIRLKQ